MKKFLQILRKPLVLVALFGSIIGAVLNDAEVTTSKPSQDTPMETLGVVLIVLGAILLAIQIWKLWLKEKFIGTTKTGLRHIGGMSLAAFLAITIVAAIGVQGQSIRLAIDTGEKSRYDASIKVAAGEQKVLEDEKAATTLLTEQAAQDLKQKEEEEQQNKAQASADEQKAAEEAKTKAETEKANAFEESRNAKNGGFTEKQIKTMTSLSKLMYSYVYVYSGYVVGNDTLAAVQLSCSKLEGSYPIVNEVSSTSPYYEDLLDRAKDYFYEAKSTCAHGFKKDRIDEIQESSTYAANAKAFFDRILKEIK